MTLQMPRVALSTTALLLLVGAPAAAEPPPTPATPSTPAPQDAPAETETAADVPIEELVRDLAGQVREMRAEIRSLRGAVEGAESDLQVPGTEAPLDTDHAAGAGLGELKKLEGLTLAPPDARALARELRPRASGDRHTLYGDVHIGEGEVVNDAFTLSGDIDIDGTVLGDAVALNGVVTVLEGGRVLGDAVSLQGDVIVEPGGLLAGEAHSMSGSVAVQPGGHVLGTTTSLESTPVGTGLGSWLSGAVGWLYGRLVFLLAFAGAGVLTIALFQDRVSRVAQALEERPAKAGFLGLVWSLGLLLVGIITFITIVGPLAAVAVLGLAWLLGFVGLCQMLGDKLGLPLPYQAHGRWAAFLIGCLLVTFVGSLPWIGILVVLAASVFGMGAVFQTRFGAR